MNKISTLFLRDPGNPLRVIDQVNAACQWVANGEGVASRKWDGQPLLLLDGLWYKRYTGDLGGYQGNDTGAIPCGEEEDGTCIWWVLVSHTRDDQHIIEAIRNANLWTRKDNGVYEVCGPHFCHNRERLDADTIIRHGASTFFGAPVEFEALKTWLQNMDMEGLVWRHPDGRMAKIKKSDFGLRRDPRMPYPPPKLQDLIPRLIPLAEGDVPKQEEYRGTHINLAWIDEVADLDGKSNELSGQ